MAAVALGCGERHPRANRKRGMNMLPACVESVGTNVFMIVNEKQNGTYLPAETAVLPLCIRPARAGMWSLLVDRGSSMIRTRAKDTAKGPANGFHVLFWIIRTRGRSSGHVRGGFARGS
jgi:hypothetical protein